MGRAAVVALVGLLPLLPAGLRAADAPAPESFRLEGIEIQREDVFSEEEADRWWPFAVANALHAVTRESFVRRELLFETGDLVDPARLQETERNLRSARLFREVSVRQEGSRAVVQTRDAWTLLPRVSISRKGGTTEWSVGVEENNLAGTGRELQFLYDKGFDRTSRILSLKDPQFFAPHLRFGASYSDLSDGQSVDLELARPFYALDVRQAGSLLYKNALADVKLYEGGDESAVWRRRVRFFRAEAGKALQSGGEGATRLSVGAEWNDVLLMPGSLGEPPPDDPRRYLFVFVGAERLGSGWIERRQVEQIDRDEDFNLALSGRVELGASPAVFGAENALRLRASGSFGTLLPNGFALVSARAESRFQSGPQNVRLVADVRGYQLKPPWTLIVRAGLHTGWRLDPEEQVYLDALAGLRGYYRNAVAAEGRVVGNVEVRRFLVSNVLRIFSLGAAAFADAGLSWGEPDGTWDLADVGVGLRIGLTRASTNTLIRVDLARALRPDPQGREGWQLSFSSGAAF